LPIGTLADASSHSYTVTATDAAGNVSQTSAPLSFIVDTDSGEQSALSVTLNRGNTINAANATSVQFTATGFQSDDNGTVTFSDGNPLHNQVVAITNGVLASTTVNLSGMNNGTITETLSLNPDAAGNTFTTVSTHQLKFNPPAITSAAAKNGHWNLGGIAPANATVTIFNGATQLGSVTATSTGTWSLSKIGTTLSVQTFTTVADGLTSATWIEGTSGNDTFMFGSQAALAAAAQIYGNGGVDTILMTAPATLVDTNFVNAHGVQDLQLTGVSTVNLSADSLAAGLTTIITGAGATSITDTNTGALTVNAAALTNNTLLTLSGSTADAVTGLIGDISASGLTGTLAVTAAQNTVDHNISIITGSGATSITDNFSTDTVSVNASALTNNTMLTLSGSAAMVVTGLIGDINASGLTGTMTVTAAQNTIDHGILIDVGSGTTTITDNFSTDTVTVIGTSGPNTIIMSGSANFVVTGGGGADTLTGGGHDTYLYTKPSDSTPSGHDTITNFNTSTDKFDFSAINGLNSNVQGVALNLNLTAAPATIAAHTIDAVTIAGNTVIYANVSNVAETINNNHEDMQINLTGLNTHPVSGDFILHH
jgi:hypothetical protein